MNKLIFLAAFFLCANYSSAQFLGGSGDGYDTHLHLNSSNIYSGGSGDGHHIAKLHSTISIYDGGSKDGYNSSTIENSISIFSGGSKDGYAQSIKILSFLWTGNSGTDWNTSGNWLNGITPSISSSVVIPPGATNFPFLSSGLLNIGQNPNNGIYECRQLLIREGAKMTLEANTFLENYNEIEIRGNLVIMNQDPSSVQNLANGLITIRSGGLLIID